MYWLGYKKACYDIFKIVAIRVIQKLHTRTKPERECIGVVMNFKAVGKNEHIN